MSEASESPISRYSHGHHRSVMNSHSTRTAENSCAYFLGRVAEGDKILDIGCGPGTITLGLAKRAGASGAVVGVDFSPDAIALAKSNANSAGQENVRFVEGDLYALDVEPASFDIVHAHQVLQHLSDPVETLRGMARYCKPGGLIAVRDADYHAMTWHPRFPGMDRWLSVYTADARSRSAEPDAGRNLRAWANAAGLAPVAVTSSTWTYGTAESAAWWGTSQADRVRNSRFAAHAAEKGLTPQDIEGIAQDWESWGNHPDAWFCMVHGEVLATVE